MNQLDPIEMLKRGIIVPKYKILVECFERVNLDNKRILDINSNCDQIVDLIDIVFEGKKYEYIGVDEGEVPESSSKSVVYRTMNFEKMKFHTDSFDLVLVQGGFLNSDDSLIDKLDMLFRISKSWVVLYNIPVIPECDLYKKNDDGSHVFGFRYIRDSIEVMQPKSVEFSYVSKSSDPKSPNSSIFIMKV